MVGGIFARREVLGVWQRRQNSKVVEHAKLKGGGDAARTSRWRKFGRIFARWQVLGVWQRRLHSKIVGHAEFEGDIQAVRTSLWCKFGGIFARREALSVWQLRLHSKVVDAWDAAIMARSEWGCFAGCKQHPREPT